MEAHSEDLVIARDDSECNRKDFAGKKEGLEEHRNHFVIGRNNVLNVRDDPAPAKAMWGRSGRSLPATGGTSGSAASTSSLTRVLLSGAVRLGLNPLRLRLRALSLEI